MYDSYILTLHVTTVDNPSLSVKDYCRVQDSSYYIVTLQQVWLLFTLSLARTTTPIYHPVRRI